MRSPVTAFESGWCQVATAGIGFDAALLAVVESCPDGLLLLDMAGSVLGCNERLAAMLGLSRIEDLPRQCESLDAWLVSLLDAATPATQGDVSLPVLPTPQTGESLLLLRDGRWLERRHRDWIVQGRKLGLLLLWRDVSVAHDLDARQRSEALLWEQANFDPLTGLPNRRLLFDRWQQASKHAQRKGLGMALLMLDLDHFKEVNDSLGHARGDELLVEVARRIKSVVRQSDVVARFGGDEFCLILTELTASAHVGDIAQKIVTALVAPVLLGTDEVQVSTSVGITLYPGDGTKIDRLLEQADQALYDAKKHGRNGFRFFTAELQRQALERLHLGQDLQQALAQQQFFLVYQPIMDLASGCVAKVEALLRWRHPQRGVLGPRAFISIAETTGLLTEISEWVLRRAAEQLHDWRRHIAPQLQMSINKSPLQSSKAHATVDDWRERLRALNLLRGAIVVEITEGQLQEPSERVGRHLHALRSIGVGVSLDDFGTGFSSLAGLQRYEIDFIKIDPSFVRDLGRDDKSLTLCKAIIGMAHELGMAVIAEGVETARQRDLLLAAGCDYAQGYFYTPPLTAAEMARWLDAVA